MEGLEILEDVLIPVHKIDTLRPIDNITFYKEYIKRKLAEQGELSYESEKYAKYWSILNRLVDWEVMDSNL